MLGLAGKVRPITLDDVMSRLAALSQMTQRPEQERVRGTGLAVAMDWVVHLPENTDKQRLAKGKALEQLVAAAEAACSVYDIAAD